MMVVLYICGALMWIGAFAWPPMRWVLVVAYAIGLPAALLAWWWMHTWPMHAWRKHDDDE